MSLVPIRATPRWREWHPLPRWKEWIPIITQQQRLRSVIQISAYNVPWYPGSCLYFTLHETTMSPPFYTSERLQHQHPNWGEIEMSGLPSTINTSATGVVVRLWLHQGKQNQDQVVLVWGVHFSGLVYLGPRLTANSSFFHNNSVVLHMQGGYFTDRHCLKELPSNSMTRCLAVTLPVPDTRPSYSVSLLLRLRNIQQAIKKLSIQSSILREKILAGGMSGGDANISRETNPTLRKLLSRGRPKPQQRQETLTVLCQVEVLRFRVGLLRQERLRKLAHLESLVKQRDSAACDNADHSCELTDRYQNLHKEIEHLRESGRHFTDLREEFLQKSSLLSLRRKQLMSQLSHIYPVLLTDGKYTICGIHLPNSEELTNADDTSVSVALGFVAHLVQMVSIFLQVPLRYPIIHFGSRSKIIDHITDKIPDKEREFPLFSRGKDKLQFHYGVYLLNKNIAQLRWLVGFPTNDLRATLHNVYHLLHLNQFSTMENHHRSMSGTSLDVISSSVNVSPVGSVVSALGLSHGIVISSNQLRARNRSSKSVGSSELLFPSNKRSGSFINPSISNQVGAEGLAASASLSYSLDKGLNEYEELKRAEDYSSKGNISRIGTDPSSISNLAHVGSEPNLVTRPHSNSLIEVDQPIKDSRSTNENAFLKLWDGTVAPLSSDEEKSSSAAADEIGNKSEFAFVTESIAKLVDSSKSFDLTTNDTNPFETSSKLESFNDDHGSKGESETVSYISRKGSTTDIVKCNTTSSMKVPCDKVHNQDIRPKTIGPTLVELRHNNTRVNMHSMKVSGSIEVDVGTDALADISNSRPSHLNGSGTNSKPLGIISDVQENIPLGNNGFCDSTPLSEHNSMECIGVEESVLVDNLFANVTSRTEALASHATSFNLMSSRHGST